MRTKVWIPNSQTLANPTQHSGSHIGQPLTRAEHSNASSRVWSQQPPLPILPESLQGIDPLPWTSQRPLTAPLQENLGVNQADALEQD